MQHFVLALLVLAGLLGLSHQDGVKVSIYYESLCYDSMVFMRHQFFPAYKTLGPHLHIEMIPYGKAIQNKVNGEWEFECQHGRRECYGNKVQACVINSTYSEETIMDFIKCAMSQSDPSSAGERCATNNGLQWTEIEQCAQSSLGSDYLAYYGNKTHAVRPAISFVPTIIYNDVFNQDAQRGSLLNFGKTVCSKYQGEKPQACSKY